MSEPTPEQGAPWLPVYGREPAGAAAYYDDYDDVAEEMASDVWYDALSNMGPDSPEWG